jgi:peroxiredoxin
MRILVAFSICGRIALALGKRRVGATAKGLAVLVVATALLGCDAPRTPGASPGATVAFELPALDGAAIDSATWRGKTVVLNVWASWCGPCRQEMASLEALSRGVDPAQVLVVGISVDEDRHLMHEYLMHERISFPILSDRTQAVVKSVLGVHSLPSTLVIGPDGAVRARVAGAKNWIDPALLEALALPPLLSERRAQLPRT